MSAELERAGYLSEIPSFFEKDGHRYELRGDRIIRDGKETAVLVSPGFGAGFSTWTDISPMNPLAVIIVLFGRHGLLVNASKEERARMGDKEAYMSGAQNLIIHWVPIGTLFRVTEYGGNERIEYLFNDGFKEA